MAKILQNIIIIRHFYFIFCFALNQLCCQCFRVYHKCLALLSNVDFRLKVSVRPVCNFSDTYYI